MVSRLIQAQDGGALKGHVGKHDTTLLTTGAVHELDNMGRALETETTQSVTCLLVRNVVLAAQEVYGSLGGGENIQKVLVVFGNADTTVNPHIALGGFKVTNHELHQSTLTDTVGTNDSDTRVLINTEGKLLEERLAALILEGHIVKGDVVAHELNLGVGELKVDNVILGALHELTLGESATSSVILFHTATLLLGASLTLLLCSELLSGLLVGSTLLLKRTKLLLLVLVLLLGLFHILTVLLLEEGVSTAVVLDALVSKAHNIGTDSLEKRGIVRDKYNSLLPLLQDVSEVNGTVKVKMVARLIKQGQSALEEEGTGNGHTHTPTTRKALGRGTEHVLGESQTSQQTESLSLGSVSITEAQLVANISELCEESFVLLHAHIVCILLIKDGHNLSLALEQLSALGIGLENHVYSGSVIGRHLLVDVNAVNLGGNLKLVVGKKAKKCTLTTTVTSNETVLTVFSNLELCVLE
mmetsp:Transcript_480/g.1163  ORF Transcript_480/g.1163 Transcript_480/m.1163 type:complete len:471 (-) Transcript_480:1087-2499(-)